MIEERWVLVMQRRQAGSNFFFLTFDGALERGVDVWLGINHLGQRDRVLAVAKSVAGVRVLELDDACDRGSARSDAHVEIAVR